MAIFYVFIRFFLFRFVCCNVSPSLRASFSATFRIIVLFLYLCRARSLSPNKKKKISRDQEANRNRKNANRRTDRCRSGIPGVIARLDSRRVRITSRINSRVQYSNNLAYQRAEGAESGQLPSRERIREARSLFFLSIRHMRTRLLVIAQRALFRNFYFFD